MISIADMFACTIVLGIAAAITGQGITALVARSVGSGASAGFAMPSGLIVSDLLYLFFAVIGLAIITQHANALFVVIRWVAIVYLLYLPWQFWRAERCEMASGGAGRKEVECSFGVRLGNNTG